MPQRTVTVTAPEGLHARPAGELVKAVGAAPYPVTVGRPDAEPVDAGSILSVMSLNIATGEQIVLTSPSDGSDALLDQLTRIVDGPESEHAG